MMNDGLHLRHIIIPSRKVQKGPSDPRHTLLGIYRHMLEELATGMPAKAAHSIPRQHPLTLNKHSFNVDHDLFGFF